MGSKVAQPWTEAHRREALRWLCGELAALEGRHMPITIHEPDIRSEVGFRRAIVREIDIDGQEIAVRRVRDLAEGRAVRDTSDRWELRNGAGLLVASAADRAGLTPTSISTDRVVRIRVTRIRRA